MSQAAGSIVRAADARVDQTQDGVSVAILADTGSAEPGLVRRLVELAPGAAFRGVAGAAGELWFVIEGTAELEVSGQPDAALRADHGVLLPPGASYTARAGQEAGLRLDTVSLPGSDRDSAHPPNDTATAVLLCRDVAGCEVETTGNRQFRVLFGPGADCATATQFVGEIPPGRAPDHSHPYDEVVLILAGHGVAPVGGASHTLAPGTCPPLPPPLAHCLQNPGSQPMH